MSEQEKPLCVRVAEAMGVKVIFHPDEGRCACGTWRTSWWEGVNWVNPQPVGGPELWAEGPSQRWRGEREREIPRFDQDWALIGYLMEQYHISVEYVPSTPYKGKKWRASIRTANQAFDEYGENARLAVCYLLITANVSRADAFGRSSQRD